jgi:uncharacterized protein (DUF302 family)
MTHNGLTTIASAHSVAETIERLVATITPLGMNVFARIDHAAGAASIGMPLRPTLLLLFGNPKGGTPLMQDKQTAGIDLPLKALAWEDANGKVWLSYNEAAWIAQRHGLGAASAGAVAAMTKALQEITAAATK